MPYTPPRSLPEWADPQQTSVMQPAWKGLTRQAARLLGLDQPPDVSSLPMGSELTSPLVSIFRNAAERSTATKAFVDQMLDAFGEGSHVANAAEKLAARYPRVAAHMKLDLSRTLPDSWRAAVGVPSNREPVKEQIPLFFSDKGMLDLNTVPHKADDALFHEATHVAQRLGNKDFTHLYKLMDSLGGYKSNPGERAARLAGTRNSQYPPEVVTTPLRGGTATADMEAGLRAWRDNDDLMGYMFPDLGADTARAKVREALEILERRKTSPMQGARSRFVNIED